MKRFTIYNFLGLLMLVVVPQTESIAHELQLICKGQAADIVFVLDSSSSIWGEHFQKQLDFAKYMVEHFDIGDGPKQVRIGVETFSDLATVHINLNSFYDKSSLIQKIGDIPQILGNTSIGDALKEMREKMFTPGNGARPAVRHVAIVLTDGSSQDVNLTQREAHKSREANIELFVIGIGNYISHSELKGIASMPKDKYLFQTPSYEVLDQIRDDVIKSTCDVPGRPSVTTERPPSPYCRGGPVDVVFVLDSSSSIWREHFQKQLDFVNYMIDNLDIGKGPKQVRVGVETFSDLATIHLHLNNDFDKFVLKWKIDQIPQILGNTSIGDALREVREIMFLPRNGARHNVRRVAIVLTDGTSQDVNMTRREAKKCRDANIELFAIGVGNYISPSELKGMASEPKHSHYFETSSYDVLDQIRVDVFNGTCGGPVKQTCNSGKVSEVVFMINNNHFGQVKTSKILKATARVLRSVEKYNNVRFGYIFDRFLHDLDIEVGSIPDILYLERDIVNFKFGPFESLIKKLRKKLFYGRSLDARRIGFLFFDNTVHLKPHELRLEAKRLSFEVIELYAAVIGDVDEDVIQNTLVPEQHIIRVPSFDRLIDDLPRLFTEMICKPF